MKSLKLIAVIILALMMISCGTTYVTPSLPVPEKPENLKDYRLTDAELNMLLSCKPGKLSCLVTPAIMEKFHMKLILYKGYSVELNAVIIENNRLAQ